jgi:hypothetical protein
LLPTCGSGTPISDAIAYTGFIQFVCDGDGDNGLDWIGDSGCFRFEVSACVSYSDPDIQIGLLVLPEIDICGLTISGSYTNQVCGTGTAGGTGTLTTTGDGSVPVTVNLWFNAGIGIVYYTADNEPGVSVVQLGPDPTAAPPTLDDCAHGLQATGVGYTWETPSS